MRSKTYWFQRRRLRRVGVAVHLVDVYRVRGEVTEGSCPGGLAVLVAP